MSNINEVLETAEASIFIGLNELKKHNIHIGDRRTSVTLEPQVWAVLQDVAKEQGCTTHELCDFINERKSEDSSLASSIRVFLISYLNIKLKKGL